MATDELYGLIRSLKGLPVAAMLTELSSHTFVALNDQAATIFGSSGEELIGADVLPHIDPRDRDAARAAYGAMADRVVDGYMVQRRVVSRDGTERPIAVWGRRVEEATGQYGLWILVPSGSSFNAVESLMVGASAVVLAVTDHDWRIVFINADAELLGARGADLRGLPVLGLVHPSAAADFLAAEARTAIEHVGVSVVVRMQVGEGRWADRYCVIVRLCEHEPPRLGLAISEGPSKEPDATSTHRLDAHVRQSAVEARAAGTLDTLPALAELLDGDELSARQIEIVARLVAGQGIAEMARGMFLSPSTIRNHLTAIYRKFGVHSQSQLLATILRALGNEDRK